MAKNLGMDQVKASGAVKRHKGDLKSKNFLVEQKDTEAKSFSLKKDVILKIYEEARRVNKTAAMAVTIDGLTVFVISEFDFKAYMEYVNNAKC